jgi:hypothetical protein
VGLRIGEISTLSRSFFIWSRGSVARSNSRFFAACSLYFSIRVICLETRHNCGIIFLGARDKGQGATCHHTLLASTLTTT